MGGKRNDVHGITGEKLEDDVCVCNQGRQDIELDHVSSDRQRMAQKRRASWEMCNAMPTCMHLSCIISPKGGRSRRETAAMVNPGVRETVENGLVAGVSWARDIARKTPHFTRAALKEGGLPTLVTFAGLQLSLLLNPPPKHALQQTDCLACFVVASRIPPRPKPIHPSIAIVVHRRRFHRDSSTDPARPQSPFHACYTQRIHLPTNTSRVTRATCKQGQLPPAEQASNDARALQTNKHPAHHHRSQLRHHARAIISLRYSRSRTSHAYTQANDASRASVFHPNTTPSATMPKEKTTRAKRGSKTEGGRKKKDPNQPKRGLSAYMFFANEQRDKVREDNPGIKFGEVGKQLGEKWKALNDKQKEPYEAKAKADKQRYEEEKAAYTAGGVDDDEDEE
ncbi:hypothetical protein Q7P37_003434 [Cladosporium fusiforme]